MNKVISNFKSPTNSQYSVSDIIKTKQTAFIGRPLPCRENQLYLIIYKTICSANFPQNTWIIYPDELNEARFFIEKFVDIEIRVINED